MRELKSAYDFGVSKIDAELGRLFDALRKRNLYENALILVTSDHGEELFVGTRDGRIE